VNFYVDDIKPVVWNDEAYGHLVYQEEQKDLVLTFVDNHQRLKAGVDDVITGKGTSSKAIYHVIPANKILQQARDLFFF
jgi:hypothetical protein